METFYLLPVQYGINRQPKNLNNYPCIRDPTQALSPILVGS